MNSAFLTDGYKLDHRRQYPEGTERVYATWIPRSNKHYPEADKVVVFGIQYALKKITEHWDKNFFQKPLQTILDSWNRRINTFLGPNGVGDEHIIALHKLGYLPIEVLSLPEGTVTNTGIPHAIIVNTHDDFAWITNFLETLFSLEAWGPSTSATTARLALNNLTNHANRTGWTEEEKSLIPFLVHDFSMRGMNGLDAAIASGMGHMTSFVGTETIPAIEGCEIYYGADAEKELLAATVPATEHSVMCAGGNENEVETFRRLLKLYPKGFLSIVSDTWDYWNVLTNILPQLKDEIMVRDGRLVIRPDSGDPVDIVCGTKIDLEIKSSDQVGMEIEVSKWLCENQDILKNTWGTLLVKSDNNYYDVDYNLTEKLGYNDTGDVEITSWAKTDYSNCELKGSYELLWDIFGGTINEKGFKVLDSHIGMIYGDAITLERQKAIYDRLENKGFAATNIVLGLGSYTYNGRTRDSLGWALKTTAVKIKGEWHDVFKDPKTVTGMPKKSLKGFCHVYEDENSEFSVVDEQRRMYDINSQLKLVYRDGKFLDKVTLSEIRERVKQSI